MRRNMGPSYNEGMSILSPSQALLQTAEERLAERLARGVCRLFEDMGFAAITEFSLANGRRVDVIGRSISMPKNETSIEAVQRYLREARTRSAALLAERPMVVAWPVKYQGQVIWDAQS